MRKRTGISKLGVVIVVVVAAAVAGAVVIVVRMDPTGRKGHGLGKEFTYDLTELRKVDPKLILFEQTRRIRTGFKDARAVAVGADGRIYLAGDKAIRILPPEAAEETPHPARIRTIRTGTTPRSLAVTDDGTVYAGLGDHVEVYDPAGRLKARWPAPAGNALLTSIAVSDEDVFAADAKNRVVWRFDRSGKLVGRIGSKDPERNVPGFVIPSPHFDLAMAGDDLLRVVSPGRLRVEAYTRDGHLEGWWGKGSRHISDFIGCCNPVNFAISPQGEFVTCEKGLRRVKLYNADGKFVGVVAPPDAFAADPPARRPGRERVGELDVALDAKGRVFVLDPYTGELKIFVRKAEAD